MPRCQRRISRDQRARRVKRDNQGSDDAVGAPVGTNTRLHILLPGGGVMTVARTPPAPTPRLNEYAPPPPTPRRHGWEPGGAAARKTPLPLRAAHGPVIRPDASEVPVDHPNPVWHVVPSGLAITGARVQSPSAGRSAGGSLRNDRRWNDGPRAQAEVARDSRSPRREGDRGNVRRPDGNRRGKGRKGQDRPPGQRVQS